VTLLDFVGGAESGPSPVIDVEPVGNKKTGIPYDTSIWESLETESSHRHNISTCQCRLPLAVNAKVAEGFERSNEESVAQSFESPTTGCGQWRAGHRRGAGYGIKFNVVISNKY